LERVDRQDFRPGDCVLFEGGGTFAGTLEMNVRDSGAPGRPVILTIYGPGRGMEPCRLEMRLISDHSPQVRFATGMSRWSAPESNLATSVILFPDPVDLRTRGFLGMLLGTGAAHGI
jgi:hypothetical protein